MVAIRVQRISGPQRSHSRNSDPFSLGQRTAANLVPTAPRSRLMVWLMGSSRVLNSSPALAIALTRRPGHGDVPRQHGLPVTEGVVGVQVQPGLTAAGLHVDVVTLALQLLPLMMCYLLLNSGPGHVTTPVHSCKPRHGPRSLRMAVKHLDFYLLSLV